MKTSSKVIWGIIILLFALGLLCYAFMPTLVIFTVPIWKWIVATILIYWIIKLVFFSKPIANKLSCIFPLGLLFVVFENEIAKLIGQKEDFVNRWIIIAGSLLLVIALQLIFHKSGNAVEYHSSSNTSSDTTYETTSNETNNVNSNNENKSFSMGSNTYYVDANKQTCEYLKNSMGELNVYFQNVDIADNSVPFEMEVHNAFGQTNIHIPNDWEIKIVNQNNSFGEINNRPNPSVPKKTINLNLHNAFGEINLR